MKPVSRGIVREDLKKKARTRSTKEVSKPVGKYGENRAPGQNVKTAATTKTNLLKNQKRPAENPQNDLPVKKQRSAFGDITNAIQVKQSKSQLKPKSQKPKNEPKSTNLIVSDLNKKNNAISNTNNMDTVEFNEINDLLIIEKLEIEQKEIADDSLEVLLSEDLCKISNDSVNFTSQCSSSLSQETNQMANSLTEDKDSKSPTIQAESRETNQPEGLREVDKDQDPVNVTEYAESIFRNMRTRQALFPVRQYLNDNPDITSQMRAVLVDWLVEVQENFELFHETLYLAVKIVDLYLQKTKVKRDSLQLVGATAMLISSKMEERSPPPLDDFSFICDDAYSNEEFIKMEINILKVLDFELGIPIPYRFLRRYSRVAGASMKTLTLARYILELSLHNHEFVDCKASEISAACLNLAFKMMKVNEWDKTLVYHTGCEEQELTHLMRQLNKMVANPNKKLTTVRMKYSHPVFHEVAKISTLTDF